MHRYLAAALGLGLFAAGLAGLTARTQPSTGKASYPVICVSRTVPGDPEPYEVCVYNPL